MVPHRFYCPPSCGKVMFSVVSVHLPVIPSIGGSHVTITHDALNLTIQGPPYRICSHLFIMNHEHLASEQLPSYWEAFL